MKNMCNEDPEEISREISLLYCSKKQGKPCDRIVLRPKWQEDSLGMLRQGEQRNERVRQHRKQYDRGSKPYVLQSTFPVLERTNSIAILFTDMLTICSKGNVDPTQRKSQAEPEIRDMQRGISSGGSKSSGLLGPLLVSKLDL